MDTDVNTLFCRPIHIRMEGRGQTVLLSNGEQ
jgi:hypothetical protein